MKYFYRGIFFVMIFFVISVFTGCEEEKKEVTATLIPSYSDAIVVEESNKESRVFNLKNNVLKESGKLQGVSEIVYNSKKPVYVYLTKKNESSSSNENKIDIFYNNSKLELSDFYYASDIKMNPSGDKIAFRSYKSNSISSAEGMRIYDIKNKEYIDLKSNVMVSGNLYSWIDENKILYYGTIQGKANSSKIYEYDISTGRESLYLTNINGYCMYFLNINHNIMYISGIGDDLSLYYYNSEDNTTEILNNNILKIYKYVDDKRDGSIFFTAVQKNNISAVYKFSYKNNNLNRITYDFPKSIEVSSGITEDENGNIYFVGDDTEDDKNSNDSMDVFVYNTKDTSISMLSSHKGKYKVYGSE
ncbi:hypothetical protein [Clostridium sp.]|jgi:hypothetical protein|uniref:hypothetical protein n=1 Tax=Clostridium sp. TaxID=1506 RepID=UPI003A5C6425